MRDEIEEAISGRVYDRPRSRFLGWLIALLAFAMLVGVLVTAAPAKDVGGDPNGTHVSIPSCAPFEEMKALLESAFLETVRQTIMVRGKLRILFSGPASWTVTERMTEGTDWFCIVNVGRGILTDDPAPPGPPKPKPSHDREIFDFQEGRERSA